MELKKIIYKNIKILYNEDFDEELLNFVEDSFLENQSNMHIIKNEKGREVYKFSVNNKSYFLKRYFYKSFNKKIKTLIRDSSAFRAFKITNQLLNSKISVVYPVLAAEYKNNLLEKSSIFISKDFNGDDLQTYISSSSFNPQLKPDIIKKTAKIWARLYDNKFINGDPNLGSILIRIENNDIKTALVDVDNIKKRKFLTKKTILNNLADFNAHSYSGLSRLNCDNLNNEDRFFFLEELSRFINIKDINKKDWIYIKNKTKEILDKWGKSNLI